jgi:GNAT superfamily N-acetyltransferase
MRGLTDAIALPADTPTADTAEEPTPDPRFGGVTIRVALLAESAGEATGFAVATVGEFFLTGQLHAQCHTNYVRPGARGGMAAVKLIEGLKRWAKAQKASALTFHVTSGVRVGETDMLLKKIGFERTGGNYVGGF